MGLLEPSAGTFFLQSFGMENTTELPTSRANQLSINYGILGAIVYIAFFMIMKVSGLILVTELRFINYVLFGLVGYFALSAARQMQKNKMDYLQSLVMSFVAGCISFFLLGVFVYFYALADARFLEVAVSSLPGIGFIEGAFGAALLIVSEGIAMSAIVSLCLMQHFRIYTDKAREIKKPRPFMGHAIGDKE